MPVVKPEPEPILLVVTHSSDLKEAPYNDVADGAPKRILIFDIPPANLSSFFRYKLPLDRLRDVEVIEVKRIGSILWESPAARDFMKDIAGLPNLKSFSWEESRSSPTFNNRIPIVHVSHVLEICQGLESLFLSGLHFQTSPWDLETNSSATLEAFYKELQDHPSLKFFRCTCCHLTDTRQVPLVEVWVERLLSVLAFTQTLGCIDIQVAPHHNAPGRVMLGLCKDGDYANTALERLNTALRRDASSFEKVRLWFADSYEPPRECEQSLLLNRICDSLAGNTWLKDFRVRGSNVAAGLFVTPSVVSNFQELLDSGRNVTMTNCDIMERQGGYTDLCCRLNGMGRGVLLKGLGSPDTMNQQEWLECIVLPFVNDLDALNYWLRLQPLFLVSETSS